MKFRLRAMLGLVALLPLLAGGCALVARGGRDLQTAGERITHAADSLGGNTPPPMTEGHSPDYVGPPQPLVPAPAPPPPAAPPP